MEEVAADRTVDVKPKASKKTWLRNCCILLLAAMAGYLHYNYVKVLHENQTYFSHLSALEREMALPTEMGFYYSFYKTLVEERPFIAGISKLMFDKLVEYPNEVNAMNRFNIYPEVILGAIYRYFEPWLNTSSHRQCHMVDRGQDLSPVQSCTGIGEPIMFYLHSVWLLAGILVAVILLHATMLSQSILGGVLAVVQYFANHSESTRVQWSPNERENFAAPLIFLQMWLLTGQLRSRGGGAPHTQIAIFLLNCFCLMFWQLSQFIFLTQTAIFFVMEQLRIIELKTLCAFLHSHFCGLHMAIFLLQGNDMLRASFYSAFFLVITTYVLLFSSMRIVVKDRVDFLIESWLVFVRICLVVSSTVFVKMALSEYTTVKDDNHISDLLYSKLTSFKSFHTLIYTCSDVFDFLPMSYVVNLSKTLLIPLTLYGVVSVCYNWYKNASNESEIYLKTVEVDDSDTSEISADDTDRNGANISGDDADDSGIENNAKVSLRRISQRMDLDEIDKDKSGKDPPLDPFLFFFRELQMNIDPAIFFNISQLLVFGVMAWLFMRLKLLFSTQMCIVCSLAVNVKYNSTFQSRFRRIAVFALIAAVLSRYLYLNVSQELSIVGEFNNAPQEELLSWISRSTRPTAVLAGSMPVLASVVLSTRRAGVAHPHYEHPHARERAYAVYKTYGRFSPEELYQELSKLKATYLIVETMLCYGKSSQGCSFADMWDVEYPSYAGRPKLCHILLTEPTEHFYKVFSNSKYAVFRIHDFSVRYMPRVFDT